MRRKHRVALRPQARRERRARWAAVLLLSGLAASAAVVIRRFPRERLRKPSLESLLPSPDFLKVEEVSFGLPRAGLQPALRATAASLVGKACWPWTVSRAARELLAAAPAIESVSASRSWRRRAITFDLHLRAPVARVLRRGRPAGWLGAKGELFEAPDGVYPAPDLPMVELGSSDDASLPRLAELIAATREGLPSKVARLAFRSEDEGWELAAADGTRLLWGKLDWTREKLARLREVLGDAGRRFGSGLTADLRYFEDGRILVQPARAAARPMMRR